MNFEKIVLVLRVGDLEPAIAEVTKSTVTQCSLCGLNVWISKAMRDVAPPDASIVCSVCFVAMGKADA